LRSKIGNHKKLKSKILKPAVFNLGPEIGYFHNTKKHQVFTKK